NLVFSLVVGGLIMVVFMTRANWEDHAKKLKAELDAVIADRDQTAKEKQGLQTKLAERDQAEENALLALAKNNKNEAEDLRKRGVVKYLEAAAEARDKA